MEGNRSIWRTVAFHVRDMVTLFPPFAIQRPPRRPVYACPFTSYDSSWGTEPRHGETVPLDMFIISTSKPLPRFSGLDMEPLPRPSSPGRLSTRWYKAIRSDGRGTWRTTCGGTRPTAKPFRVLRGRRSFQHAITLLPRHFDDFFSSISTRGYSGS